MLSCSGTAQRTQSCNPPMVCRGISYRSYNIDLHEEHYCLSNLIKSYLIGSEKSREEREGVE